jgi:hypothetical protein
MKHDVYIANYYIKPEDSIVHKNLNCDIFEVLCEEIGRYSAMRVVGVVGDLNACTGSLSEKLSAHNVDYTLEKEINICNDDSEIPIMKRNNIDRTINTFGRKLLQIISSHNMVIANRRTTSDTNLEKTCYGKGVGSTVDFLILPINHLQLEQ